MAIEIGTTDIRKIEIGTTNVKDVRIGSGSPIYVNIYDAGSQSYSMTTGFSSGTDGVVTYGGSFITVAAGFNGSNTTTNERTARTSSTVDLTNIKTLYIDWEAGFTGSTSQVAYFIVSTSSTGSQSTFAARVVRFNTDTARAISSLDVSSLSGGYFIRIHQRDGSTSNLNGGRIFIYRIWGI
jgi:hypothetical protein